MSTKKKVLVILLPFLSITLLLYIISSAWDMTLKQRISKEVTSIVTQKLVDGDLTQEARVKSSVGDYFVPDLSSQKVRNDLSSTLWLQVIERANVFPLSAPPIRVNSVWVPDVQPSGTSDPQLVVNVDTNYVGLFSRIRDLQVIQYFSLPQYSNQAN